jgi:monoterpene epsilon-lactone hydrolase
LGIGQVKADAGDTGMAAPESRIAADASVMLPPIHLPFARYASAEARTAFASRFAAIEPPPDANDATIAGLRTHYDAFNRECLQAIAARFPFEAHNGRLGGIEVQSVVPAGGSTPVDKVLICLHGGGFLWGTGAGALVEAVPIACATGLRTIAVHYRLAPEHRFPAASTDVVAVYHALLKDYRPEDIAIFGSSAGALLTAQVVAALIENGSPLPAAIGTFFAATNEITSDSLHLATPALGQEPWQGDRVFAGLPYFADIDLRSPLVLPGNSDALIARFPPTLIATATRDFAMSACAAAHRQLVRCGATAELHVWDGLWHAFPVDCGLPESMDFYEVASRFFARHLGLPAPETRSKDLA